jgi:hypothetical protein
VGLQVAGQSRIVDKTLVASLALQRLRVFRAVHQHVALQSQLTLDPHTIRQTHPQSLAQSEHFVTHWTLERFGLGRFDFCQRVSCHVRHQLALRREFLLTVGTNVIGLFVRAVRIVQIIVNLEKSLRVENSLAGLALVVPVKFSMKNLVHKCDAAHMTEEKY